MLRPPRTLLPLLAVIGLISLQALAACAIDRPAAASSSPAAVLLREVSPQRTDPAIDAWAEPHVVALDPAAPSQGRLFVFFSGSFGLPQNQRLLLEQAARSGYHTIGLRYPNSWTVNDLCASAEDPACFGVLLGVAVMMYRPRAA